MFIIRNFKKGMVLFIITLSVNTMNAQNNLNASQSLNEHQQSIVSIAALTAVGDIGHLHTQFNTGLDGGLTINEI